MHIHIYLAHIQVHAPPPHPGVVSFFYKTLSFNSALQLLTDVAIFLCFIHIFSARSLKTKTLWESCRLLGTWSNLLHFVSLIVFFEDSYNLFFPCCFSFVSYILYQENLVSKLIKIICHTTLIPSTFNDKPVIAISKTAFLILE